MVSQWLKILHDHAQPAHAEAIPDAFTLHSAVLQSQTVVEILLCLTPVAALRQVGPEKRGVDAPEVAFSDVGLEDVRADEEDLTELTEELEAFV